MEKPLDVIIVGAGHNGLTAAAYLAKAGKKVLILERRSCLGGIAATEEIWPGFKFSPAEQQSRLVPYQIRADLELARHGLRCITMDPAVFLPSRDNRGLLIPRDVHRIARDAENVSRGDAESLPRFDRMIRGLARLIHLLHRMPAPNIPKPAPADLVDLLKLLKAYRGLGESEMWNALRVLPMRVSDLLEEWFESDQLKAAIASNSVLHECAGPRTAGTTFLLLNQRLGAQDGAFACGEIVPGGLGGLASSLASAATNYSACIRTDAEVAAINVLNGKAVGVTLTDGSEVSAKTVVSNADPKRTFLNLVDPTLLDPEFLLQIQNIRMRGVTSKVNLALDELPNFKCRPGSSASEHHQASVILAEHPDDVERAYDSTKYGELSERPVLELSMPSLLDPTLAPPGKHVMTINVQYTPYHLRNATWNDERERLGDLVVDVLSEYITNIKQIILHRQVLTPLDLERTYYLTEGHLTHGECSLSQILYMRPVEGWGRHTTPIPNLYLCGAGTHPGGTVTCEPGRLAALRILKEHRK